MIKRILSMTSLILLLPCSVVHAYTCGAKITNKSSSPWTFSFKPSDGNVHFNAGVSCQINGPCIIPPHTTAYIEYTTSAGAIRGAATITDSKQRSNSFRYSTIMGRYCPLIIHTGRTGSISLNEPEDGSYAISGEQW
jgi:hypothetical protein